MTQDDRKTWYWTGGITVALIGAVLLLWAAGVFQISGAQ